LIDEAGTDLQSIIPPEWRPGFLLDWGEGGNDDCGNDNDIVIDHSHEKTVSSATKKHVAFQLDENPPRGDVCAMTLSPFTAVTLKEQEKEKEDQEEDQVVIHTSTTTTSSDALSTFMTSLIGDSGLETAPQDRSRAHLLQLRDGEATMQAVGKEKDLHVATATTTLDNAAREPPETTTLGKPTSETATTATDGLVVDDNANELETPSMSDREAGKHGSVVTTSSRPNFAPQEAGGLLSPSVCRGSPTRK
jgi:hypothetical protein